MRLQFIPPFFLGFSLFFAQDNNILFWCRLVSDNHSSFEVGLLLQNLQFFSLLDAQNLSILFLCSLFFLHISQLLLPWLVKLDVMGTVQNRVLLFHFLHVFLLTAQA